jgi:site-specific recombinase XerD
MFDLGQLHKEFINQQRYLGRLSEVTLRGYEQSFALLQEVMPDLSLSDLSSKSLTEFFRRLDSRSRIVGRGIKKVGIKKSTAATYRSKLNRFFEWLEKTGHIKQNPFALIQYPDVQYEDRKFLGRSEIQKIFTALALSQVRQGVFIQRRNLAIFATLLYTGIRKSELLGLQVTDLDLQRRELMVRAETSKSRLRRTVPISSEHMKLVRDYLTERVRKRLTTPYLFVSSARDDKLSADGLKHLIESVQRASGVKFHVHQFRHTFAVNVLNNGSDIAKLKQLLGHRDIRMTATYLRCLPTSAMRGDVETLTLDNLV